jgi:transposase
MAPHTDISMRALIVTLKSPLGGRSTSNISAITGVAPRTVNNIYARAIERGFDPNYIPIVIKDEFLEDAPKSGRPIKQTDYLKEAISTKVCGDRYGRELSCADIAGFISTAGFDISAKTVWRILRKMDFKKTKPTRKPGLTKKMRDERLRWCIDHQDWTLEDWKNVIWSDETSIVLNHRRGGYRIWRTSSEAIVKSCIRERWKGYSEFMFWACFTYDKKGPCHCYTPETAQEKREAQEIIDQMNIELEPLLRTEWELRTSIARVSLRNLGGPKPQWKWNQKNGKLARSKNGGID